MSRRVARKRVATSTDRVVIYARLSQDRHGEGLAVARQIKACQKLIESKDWTLVETFEENDTSAMKAQRPEFERLLEFCAANPDVHIVCWHTDRLVRLTADLERVIELDLTVYGVEAGHLDLSTPQGRAVARTVTAWATYEGEQKAIRQIEKHEQRAHDQRLPFLGGTEVFGYIKDKATRTYLKHPVEAPAVAEAYDMLLAGVTTGRIAEHLNGQGFTTGHGNPWDYRTVKNLLVHPRNAAILVYNEVELGPGAWEPIVDEITMRSARLLLLDPARRTTPGPTPSNPLTGIIRCGECGAAARVKTVKDGRGSYKVYHCRDGHTSARAAWLEDHVVALMSTRIDGGYDEEASVDADAGTIELLAERKRLRLKGEEYEAALDNDDMTLEQFTRLNKKNRVRIDQITEELTEREIGSSRNLTRKVEDFSKHWDAALTVDERRVVAQGHIERIELQQRGRGVKRDFPGHVLVWVKGNPVPHELDGRRSARHLVAV